MSRIVNRRARARERLQKPFGKIKKNIEARAHRIDRKMRPDLRSLVRAEGVPGVPLGGPPARVGTVREVREKK